VEQKVSLSKTEVVLKETLNNSQVSKDIPKNFTEVIPVNEKINITEALIIAKIELPKHSEIPTTKISALSLSSIRAKKELEAQLQFKNKHEGELPNNAFSEKDMLLVWNKFAKRLADQNKRLMATYMLMSIPTLNGAKINLELPNQSTREEFETGNYELLGYLRVALHNHDITIEVIVNETVETKYAFTPDDKYDKLNAINPAMELLRKTFDLDV